MELVGKKFVVAVSGKTFEIFKSPDLFKVHICELGDIPETVNGKSNFGTHSKHNAEKAFEGGSWIELKIK